LILRQREMIAAGIIGDPPDEWKLKPYNQPALSGSGLTIYEEFTLGVPEAVLSAEAMEAAYRRLFREQADDLQRQLWRFPDAQMGRRGRTVTP